MQPTEFSEPSNVTISYHPPLIPTRLSRTDNWSDVTCNEAAKAARVALSTWFM